VQPPQPQKVEPAPPQEKPPTPPMTQAEQERKKRENKPPLKDSPLVPPHRQMMMNTPTLRTSCDGYGFFSVPCLPFTDPMNAVAIERESRV
jgi:hypothetical protein